VRPLELFCRPPTCGQLRQALAQTFTLPRRVVTEETEGYHTRRRNLNALRHNSGDIRVHVNGPSADRRSSVASGNLNSMKVALGIAVILLIAFSLFADYKWKQWMAARKQDHQDQNRR